MSIHIKPENKGKFTAYKKRTGKTTEEALHSKDPHVRKMAQFAKNASHWHHATGGVIQSYAEGGTIEGSDQSGDPVAPKKFGGASTRDSLDVYNNAKKVDKYYKDKGYYTAWYSSGTPESNGVGHYWDKESMKAANHEGVFKNPKIFKQFIDNNTQNFIAENSKGNIAYMGRPNKAKLQTSDYTQVIDKNRFKQRDGSVDMLDLKAPASLYDLRINPQAIVNLNKGGHSAEDQGNAVWYYEYDPIAVKPYSMRTAADHTYIKKNYPEQYKRQEAKAFTQQAPAPPAPPPSPVEKQVVSQYNQMVNGQRVPIDADTYNKLMSSGTVTTTKTGQVLDKDKYIVKPKSFGLGGEIGQAGGALAGQALIPIPGIGGIIGGAVGGFLGNTVDKMFTPSNYNSAAMKNSNPYGYATGGSTQTLSPNAVEVTGAPNVTDGNSININGTPINADHGEVIDTTKSRVFSDILYDPRTGDKFSDQAKKLEKATNKLKNPSVINDATKKALERNKDNLFQAQENIAAALGLRNPNGTTKQGVAPSWANTYGEAHSTGGTINDILTDPSNPNRVNAQGVHIGQHSHVKHSKDRAESWAAPNYAYGGQPLTPQSEWLKGPWDNPLSFQDAFQSNPQPPLPDRQNQYYGQAMPPAKGFDPNRYGNNVPIGSVSTGKTPPILDLNPNKIRQGVMGAIGDYNPTGVTSADNMNKAFDPAASTKSALGIGDYLQLGSAGASVLGAVLDTPETQKLYTNNAPITNQQYDPSRALMNNQFSTNAARQDLTNTYSASGANANLQNLYANKFRSDADIVSNYDRMNKQATTEYQGRLAQRQGENNAARYHTDDVNMANRATYMNNLYGALGTVNQVGAGFNKAASDSMAVKYLMQIDPEAAKWITAGGDINDFWQKKWGLKKPTDTATTKDKKD